MTRTLNILIIDDDQADIELTRIALSEYDQKDFKIQIHEAHDGVEGIEFLNDPQKPNPDVVFLDLNMPRKDGRTTLAEIRNDLNLRRLPIAILTTSDSHIDVNDSYEKGCTCFITKPVGIDQFKKVLHSFSSFWFSVAKLPEQPTQL